MLLPVPSYEFIFQALRRSLRFFDAGMDVLVGCGREVFAQEITFFKPHSACVLVRPLPRVFGISGPNAIRWLCVNRRLSSAFMPSRTIQIHERGKPYEIEWQRINNRGEEVRLGSGAQSGCGATPKSVLVK